MKHKRKRQHGAGAFGNRLGGRSESYTTARAAQPRFCIEGMALVSDLPADLVAALWEGTEQWRTAIWRDPATGCVADIAVVADRATRMICVIPTSALDKFADAVGMDQTQPIREIARQYRAEQVGIVGRA
jgi:hypothetical protein